MKKTLTSSGSTRPGILARVFAYRWLLGLTTLVFFLDQVTKGWIHARLPLPTYGEPHAITVIPGFFNIVHVGNTGAAWSLFTGQSTWLALLAIATLFGIYFFRRHLGLSHIPVQVSFGLLCGGIIGNLVDRLVHGHVIDFLDFHFGSFVWPTFNIADTAICIGVGLYIFYSFREPQKE